MPIAAIVLVETSLPGNLGAALRVAANFGVAQVHLVRPRIDPTSDEVTAWACGAHDRVEIIRHDRFDEAISGYRTVVASASGRGRDTQPFEGPREAMHRIATRGPSRTAVVFGNETSGLSRSQIDRCDVTVRIPTHPEFPVLNLTQSIAILLGYLSMELAPAPPTAPTPADQTLINGLMKHLASSLASIGFLDPANPDRVLRKLRRMFGRAGITENEVAILRGICRQIDWAATHLPSQVQRERGDGES